MRTQIVRGWFVGLLAALAWMLAGAPAVAHSDLESSNPEDGATLASAPVAMEFVFNEEILPEGNAVTLTDVAADSRLDVGPVVVDGDTVSVAWPESSPAGEFRAAYRVVSADGHPINGTITFTVQEAVGADGAGPAAVSGSASPAVASGSPSASPADPDSVSASPTAEASVAPAPVGDDADGGVLAWLGLGLAVVVGVGAGTWVLRRTR